MGRAAPRTAYRSSTAVVQRLQQGGLVDRPRQSRPASAIMVEGAYRPAFGLGLLGCDWRGQGSAYGIAGNICGTGIACDLQVSNARSSLGIGATCTDPNRSSSPSADLGVLRCRRLANPLPS